MIRELCCTAAILSLAMPAAAPARAAAPPRMVLAFYYPWYGNPDIAGGSGRWSHWEGVDPARHTIRSATHYPELGAYDSLSPDLIARHCRMARDGGLDGLIASWWGKGSFEDRAMPRLLDAAAKTGLKVSIYYETVAAPRSADAAAADIADLLARFTKHPAWLKVDGRPVVFIYSRAVDEIGLEGWSDVVAILRKRIDPAPLLIGDNLGPASALVFDGTHTYNTAGLVKGMSADGVAAWARLACPNQVDVARSRSRISTVTVIPGYDDTKIRKPGLRVDRLDGRLYAAQWEQAIAADPDWVLVTSFNEWHEGSEIEPSHEDGRRYLDMTAKFAARFKALPADRRAPTTQPDAAPLTEGMRRRLRERLAGVSVALLPGADSYACFWLGDLGITPSRLTWKQLVNPPKDARPPDVLIYGGGESYRQTVRAAGDVDAAIARYLSGGGRLAVLPAGPVPFYRNEKGEVVDRGAAFGLSLGIGPQQGGWEQPPADAGLRFHRASDAMESLPVSFAFPVEGDRRWRPILGGGVVPLLTLRDRQGKARGTAVGWRPVGAGVVVYAWFDLLNGPQADALLHDLFNMLANDVKRPSPGRN
ncbi:MAG: hypothetical protein BIFFINMI_00273 [Phycisphaerae bacterium]|nr:hypothetical protein [Phycisphaerae bacterium]